MNGVFIGGRRPASKKEVKQAVKEQPESVLLERTALLGHEYEGPVSEAPPGQHTFVGPDPYTSRKFYGTVSVSSDGRVRVV